VRAGPAPVTCPQCGQANPAGAKFCLADGSSPHVVLHAEALHALGARDDADVLLCEVQATAARVTIAPVVWPCAPARAVILEERRSDEAAALRAEVRTSLARVVADLPEELRASAVTVSLVRRAGGI